MKITHSKYDMLTDTNQQSINICGTKNEFQDLISYLFLHIETKNKYNVLFVGGTQIKLEMED